MRLEHAKEYFKSVWLCLLLKEIYSSYIMIFFLLDFKTEKQNERT